MMISEIETISETEPLPLCPTCDKPMRLDHATPRRGAQAELRSFVCPVCREALTFSDDGKGLGGRRPAVLRSAILSHNETPEKS